tara:strand:+ start:898 stop:1959 length:1062 start_codon:yes stop_codon:yes gene_type:complete
MEIRNNISNFQRFQYGCYQFMDHFFGRPKAHKMTEGQRRKYYHRLLDSLKEKGEGKVIPLERRKDLSLKEFKEQYLSKGKPVILEGAAKEWDCVKNWGLDYFKQLHGTDEIIVMDQKRMEDPYERMTLADIIDGIKEGKGKYYRFYPLLEKHPEHILDFDYKWLRERRNPLTAFEAFQVFIGGDGSLTPLHNANQCNLFTQVVGEKKWMLYHPMHTAIIDPEPVRNVYRSAPCRKEGLPFDPFEPNYEAPYGLFKYIDSYSVHLKPGDVLWNPPFYWHAVKNVGDSIGVGYRWLPPLYCFKNSFLYSLLDLFAKNPPIWKSYKLYNQDINLIHMAEYGQLEKYKLEELEKKGS